ncbi:MAG: XRE family transcriptional regulator [Rickettsiales bacterium]|nr:XRE family transcriptional regulator [Rickettsiales bacterium]
MSLIPPLSAQSKAFGDFVRDHIIASQIDQREVVNHVLEARKDLEAVRVYWWLDGVEPPRSEAEFGVLMRACGIAENGDDWNKAHQLYVAAIGSLPDQPREISAPHFNIPVSPDTMEARNYGNVSHAMSNQFRYRLGYYNDLEDMDEPRIFPHRPDSEHGYLYVDRDVLQTISEHTENMHEFIRVNRLLSGLRQEDLNRSIDRVNQMVEYEARAQHPPKDVVERMQEAMFRLDTEEGRAKADRLYELSIRDKVKAAKFMKEKDWGLGNEEPNPDDPEAVHHYFKSYVQYALELPREYWEYALYQFNFPNHYAALEHKPVWEDTYITPATMGEYIRAARLTLGMTQEELADRAGVTRSVISNLDNDRDYYLTRHDAILVFALLERENRRYQDGRMPRGPDHPRFPFFNPDRAAEMLNLNEFQRDQALDIATIQDRFEDGEIDEATRDDQMHDVYDREPPEDYVRAGTRVYDVQFEPKDLVRATYGRRGRNEVLNQFRDPVGMWPRHRLFAGKNIRTTYQQIATRHPEGQAAGLRQLARIQRETKNLFEFVQVSRLLRPPPLSTARDDLSVDVEKDEIRNVENGRFLETEKMEMLRDDLFPIPEDDEALARTNQDMRARFDDLWVRGVSSIIGHNYYAARIPNETGKRIIFSSNIKQFPSAYWDQVFARFNDEQAWNQQADAPLWKDATMQLPSAGLFLMALRTKEGLSQQDLADKTGLEVGRIRFIENESKGRQDRVSQEMETICDALAADASITGTYNFDKAKNLPLIPPPEVYPVAANLRHRPTPGIQI